ncbi:MAG: phosphoribosylformylglycinamidine synthase I [Endomicrobium sp.]|jgi:phosphoribosylformylglycinamidine synthase|nr:phosphoribosylformylglycinamidine synthase I [Endomicrobium sp.]
MKKVRVLVLRTAGTNCDYETQFAFELCGAHVERVHVNVLIEKKEKIFEYDILAFPCGFSYGDDIASGKILSNEVKNKLGDRIKKFALDGRPVIRICNGFQVFVKMGLLPDLDIFEQVSTLYRNDSNKFECCWVYLKNEERNNCIWTKKLLNIISSPVAHSECKFVPINRKLLDILNKNNQVVFKYSSKSGNKPKYPLNPNGSIEEVATLSNVKGNVFVIMPHPERYIFALQHPGRIGFNSKYGFRKIIFQNAVYFVK